MVSDLAIRYREQGFAILDCGLRERVLALRAQFLRVFDTIAATHRLGPVKEDADVVRLYHGERRDLWVAAYDQLRQLPALYALADDATLEKIQAAVGLRFPAFTAKIATRVDMPFGEGSMPTSAHQDYPTHLGSENSVTVWMPLHDVTVSDGALQVVPGSHRWGLLGSDRLLNDFVEPGKLRRREGANAHMQAPDELAGKFRDLEVRAGQAIVFSTFLIHRSGENTGSRIRWAINFRLNDLASAGYARRLYYLNEQVRVKSSVPDFTPSFSEE
jgi:hypothetical protein